MTARVFRLAGIAWGVAAALVAGVLGAAAGVAVLWALVFGDDPWPPITAWLIGAVALAAAGSAFAAVVSIARERAVRAERLAAAHARRQALVWLGAGVLAIALVLAGGGAWIALERDATAEARAAEARYQALAATVHAPTSVTLDVQPVVIALAFSVDGQRAGSYRLTARLSAPHGKRPLAQRTETIALDRGPTSRTERFETAALLAAYREQFLRGGLGSIDQSLTVELILDPVLTPAESDLARGRLPLLRSARTSKRIAFVAAPDGNHLPP